MAVRLGGDKTRETNESSLKLLFFFPRVTEPSLNFNLSKMAYQIISILHFTGYIAYDFPRDIHIYWVDTFEKQFKKYVKVAPLRLV